MHLHEEKVGLELEFTPGRRTKEESSYDQNDYLLISKYQKGTDIRVLRSHECKATSKHLSLYSPTPFGADLDFHTPTMKYPMSSDEVASCTKHKLVLTQ
jgi:hypothetical protein